MTDKLHTSKTPMVAKLRRLSFVPRWVVIPTLRTQSVAEHSYHVAWLWEHMAATMRPHMTPGALPPSYILKVLEHDADEAITGDTPTTAKTHAEPTSPEEALLKFADKLEAVLFLNEEIKMGNMAIGDVFTHGINAMNRSLAVMDKFVPEESLEALSKFAAGLLTECGPHNHPSLNEEVPNGTTTH